MISSKYDAATYQLGPWAATISEMPSYFDTPIGVYVPFKRYTHEWVIFPVQEQIDPELFPDGGRLFCEFEQHLQDTAIGKFQMTSWGISFAEKNDATNWIKYAALLI